ncbi:hypothetical protein D3C87_1871570 [compost metagenome]
MRFIAATWLTIVAAPRFSTSASEVSNFGESFICRRSAESWIGVSGFLISWASRRATSPQATERWAEITSEISSKTTT